MSTNPDCVFCKIIAGEIPSFKVYEDDKSLAFMDINPANEGHVLAIPKNHSPNLFEIPADDIAAAANAARLVARALREEMNPEGLNLVQANGPAAKQSVMHFHIHILPRRMGDDMPLNWPIEPGDKDVIGAVAERLRARLG